MISKKLSISVISFILDIGIDINSNDLLTLGLYLPIDDQVKGLELNYLRGVKIIRRGIVFNTKNNFYNQLTLLIMGKKVKIFTGGKVHICGCKLVKESTEIFDIIKTKLLNFYVDLHISYFPLGQFVIDSENYLYHRTDMKIIGMKLDKTIYLNGEAVELKINKFNKEIIQSLKYNINGIKKIYDYSGNIIGTILKKDNKTKNDVFNYTYVNNQPIERLVFNGPKIFKDIKLVKNDIILLNSTYKVNIPINKLDFKGILDKLGMHTHFEPLIYHALKLMYYFGDNAVNGICKCSSKESTCTCTKTTSIISGNGSILLYGFKSIETRDIVYNFINTNLVN